MNDTWFRRWLTPRRLTRFAAELLLFLLLLLALEWFLTRDAARGPAPPIEARLIDGRPFSLAQLRGQPALVYFWGSWCPVCAAQQGTLDGLVQDYPAVTVAMQSGSEAEVAAYLREQGLAWPTINDPQGDIARAFGVRGVPAVFVLDAAGNIRFVTRGYTTGPGLRLRLWWVR